MRSRVLISRRICNTDPRFSARSEATNYRCDTTHARSLPHRKQPKAFSEHPFFHRLKSTRRRKTLPSPPTWNGKAPVRGCSAHQPASHTNKQLIKALIRLSKRSRQPRGLGFNSPYSTTLHGSKSHFHCSIKLGIMLNIKKHTTSFGFEQFYYNAPKHLHLIHFIYFSRFGKEQ